MSLHFPVFNSGGLVRQRKVLEEMRNCFLYNSQAHLSIRSIVYDSWVRCLQSGIDPRRKQTKDPLEDEEIKNIILSSELYKFSVATLEELLIHTKETRHILTLSDSEGHLIFLGGNRSVKHRAESINFVLGSNWSEQVIGTNAIGTSLATGHPVQIFAAEHFCEGIHNWVCSSSPIHDPLTKKVLGVVDVTGPWKEVQAHSLGMSVMASKAIELKFHEQVIFTRTQLIERYSSVILRYPQSGVIVLDSAFHPIKANPYASEFLQKATGKSLGTLWTEQGIDKSLKRHHNSLHPKEECEFFIQQLGINALILEIYQANKLIGYILIFKSLVRKTITPRSLENNSLDNDPWKTSPWKNIIGDSSSILSAKTKCNLVASKNVSVLLIGESGTGKELFAQAIHQTSDRRKGPFVTINCGAVPKELLASELFGYDPGTFTGAVKVGKRGKFEQAHKGTLFLDEVGEMPLEFQVHLLRVLQEREVVRLGGSKPIPVDVKIIAATHQNLEQLVQKGLLRADFYYRLQVVSIGIPPLRERRDDIPLLIDHFMDQFTHKYDKQIIKLDQHVREFLINTYQWPGNVRELQNTLEHAVLFCMNGSITIEDLPQTMQKNVVNDLHWRRSRNSKGNRKEVSNEREALLSLLQESGGNLSATARQLGVARTTLYRHMDKYGICKVFRGACHSIKVPGPT